MKLSCEALQNLPYFLEYENPNYVLTYQDALFYVEIDMSIHSVTNGKLHEIGKKLVFGFIFLKTWQKEGVGKYPISRGCLDHSFILKSRL